MDKHKGSLYVPLRFSFTPSPDSVLTALLASYRAVGSMWEKLMPKKGVCITVRSWYSTVYRPFSDERERGSFQSTGEELLEALSSEGSPEARGLCTATRWTAGRAAARRRDGQPRIMACAGGLGGADLCPGSSSASLLPWSLRRAWSLLALALLATPLLARQPRRDPPLTTGMSQPPRRRSRKGCDLSARPTLSSRPPRRACRAWWRRRRKRL